MGQRVAENIYKAMSKAGLGRPELAARSGVPYSTIAKRLSGKTEIFIHELAAIASACGVTTASLLVDPDERERKTIDPDLRAAIRGIIRYELRLMLSERNL